MLRRVFVSLLGVALLVGFVAAQEKKDAPKKGASTKDAKKDAKEAPKDAKKVVKKADPEKGTPGKVLKVDVEKRTVQVELEGGKRQDYTLDEEVKFIGPRGGVSERGIKDDRFVAGNLIRVVTDAGGKKVTEIHLPYRRSEEKDKADKKDKAPEKKDKADKKDKAAEKKTDKKAEKK